MSIRIRKIFARILLTLIFCGIGSVHLLAPERVVELMPPYLPAPKVLNFVSGVFEILGGIGVWSPWPKLRAWAGYGLVALLISVFVVNIDMALYGSPMRNGGVIPVWILWARLPWQFVMMWLALYGTREDGVREARTAVGSPVASRG